MKKTIFLLVVFVGIGILLMGGLPVKESGAAPKIVIRAVTALAGTPVWNGYFKEII